MPHRIHKARLSGLIRKFDRTPKHAGRSRGEWPREQEGLSTGSLYAHRTE